MLAEDWEGLRKERQIISETKIKMEEGQKEFEAEKNDLAEDWEDLREERLKICETKIKLEKNLKELEEARNTFEIEKTQMNQSRFTE